MTRAEWNTWAELETVILDWETPPQQPPRLLIEEAARGTISPLMTSTLADDVKANLRLVLAQESSQSSDTKRTG